MQWRREGELASLPPGLPAVLLVSYLKIERETCSNVSIMFLFFIEDGSQSGINIETPPPTATHDLMRSGMGIKTGAGP